MQDPWVQFPILETKEGREGGRERKVGREEERGRDRETQKGREREWGRRNSVHTVI